MVDLVAAPLELDRAEEELGRRFSGPGIGEPTEPPGKWTNAILISARRGYRALRFAADATGSAHVSRARSPVRPAVAKAVERSGIVATYRLHDRVLSNRSSRRLYAEQPPALNALQQRTVAALDAEGYATVPFTELVSDDELRSSVLQQVPISSTRQSKG